MTSLVRVACAQLVARDIHESERALDEALEAVAEAASLEATLVVLPECTYPAYVLADPASDLQIRSDEEVEGMFAAVAKERAIWVAVGLAQGWGRGVRDARNTGLLFGPDGSIHLRAAKRFLWDFDRRWFAPGGPAEPTPWLGPDGIDAGLIGMLVCADARMPEIARSLAVGGARLILDPTAWVATGRESASLSNLQPEYLLSVRAYENGVWIAAADKVGLERQSVVYAGRSCVVAPDGSITAMASSDEPEVIWTDIDLSQASRPPVSRRPELYARVTDTDPSSAAAMRAASPLVVADGIARIGLLQSISTLDAPTLESRFASLETTARALGLQVVAAVAAIGVDEAMPLAQSLSASLDAAVAVAAADDVGQIRALHLSSDGVVATAMCTHGDGAVTGEGIDSRTIDVGSLRVGILVGQEGLVPEVARIVTLQGAELLVWAADAGTPLAQEVARVRAVENRVWVGLMLTSGGSPDPSEPVSMLIDPDGRVVAVALRGRDQLVAGVVSVASARMKQMAPGTDILMGRQPGTYFNLTDVHAVSAT